MMFVRLQDHWSVSSAQLAAAGKDDLKDCFLNLKSAMSIQNTKPCTVRYSLSSLRGSVSSLTACHYANSLSALGNW